MAAQDITRAVCNDVIFPHVSFNHKSTFSSNEGKLFLCSTAQ